MNSNKLKSIKQSNKPESTNPRNSFGTWSECNEMRRDFGSVRAAAPTLRRVLPKVLRQSVRREERKLPLHFLAIQTGLGMVLIG